jgi:hypothetical protein
MQDLLCQLRGAVKRTKPKNISLSLGIMSSLVRVMVLCGWRSRDDKRMAQGSPLHLNLSAVTLTTSLEKVFLQSHFSFPNFYIAPDPQHHTLPLLHTRATHLLIQHNPTLCDNRTRTMDLDSWTGYAACGTTSITLAVGIVWVMILTWRSWCTARVSARSRKAVPFRPVRSCCTVFRSTCRSRLLDVRSKSRRAATNASSTALATSVSLHRRLATTWCTPSTPFPMSRPLIA